MPERSYAASTLWLDNRGGSAGVLTIGRVETRVEDSKLERIEVTGCPQPVPLSFAGTTLGELPAASAENAQSSSPWAIADPSGHRCYEEFSVYYGRTEDGGGIFSFALPIPGKILFTEMLRVLASLRKDDASNG